jgi:hypothetical protein
VLLEQAEARLEHAKALAALGAQLRRDRRPTDAREPLRRALELGEICGAKPLADEARAEIYATGARPRTAALRGVESTDGERTAGRRPCRRRSVEPRHRPDALPDPEDGRGAPDQLVPQARNSLAAAARRHPRAFLSLSGGDCDERLDLDCEPAPKLGDPDRTTCAAPYASPGRADVTGRRQPRGLSRSWRSPQRSLRSLPWATAVAVPRTSSR